MRRLVFYALAGLLVLGVGAWRLASSGSGVEPLQAIEIEGGDAGKDARPSGTGETRISPVRPLGSAAGNATSTTQGRIFVQVAGAVVHPGVYQIQAGARVFEAVALAGGAAAGAAPDLLPLAAQLVDGARIYVPLRGEKQGEVSGLVQNPGVGNVIAPTGPKASTAARVSLNTAGVAELESLPGIGPKTAEKIVAYRESHGPFSSVDDLDAVPGIGPALVERLRDLVSP